MMSGFQSRKGQDLQNPFPGCMGTMINMFDLSTHMNGTKLLTEKPHGDDFVAVRNHSDVMKKPIDPFVVQREDEHISGEQRKNPSNKKSSRMSMKMLIAKEMWKETESKQKPTGVVARLMGLDSLPVHQAGLTDRHNTREVYQCNGLTGAQKHHQQKEDEYIDKMPCDLQSCAHEEKEYKDVYEAWRQPVRTNLVKDQFSWKGKFDKNSYQRRMAFVQQTKHLATDEKFLQSKEFQDAIEVLSSNKDLFLGLLEEPNSLLPKHLCELQSVPPASQTERITVLKPSNTIGTKGDRVMEEQLYEASEENVGKTNGCYRSSSFSQEKPQILSQPTRIVVLKPSPLRPYHIKTTVASLISSPKPLDSEGSCEVLETDEAVGSREIAKEITRQMRESLSNDRTDEALLSSLLSNRYFQDERSFNRSENEQTEEEAACLSDMEIVTPTSRYSCDYPNVVGSPYSISSLSRLSHSPESAVMREAKKRLSERLALVTSIENGQEQIQEGRSSSTLGEMLAIPEVKKKEGRTLSGLRLSNEKCDIEVPMASLSTGQTKDEYHGENSSRSLSRSKSVPLSPLAYETVDLNVGASSSLMSEQFIREEVPKSKSGKSSFKVKVSSLFFSRKKKQNIEKLAPPPTAVSDDSLRPGTAKAGGKGEDLSQSVNDVCSAESNLVSPDKIYVKAYSSSFVYDGSNQATLCAKEDLSLDKSSMFGNLDRPSPLSVLEALCIGDANNRLSQSIESAIVGYPQALSRSPPIESVARCLSKDFSYMETTPNPLKSSIVLSKADEEHEQFVFVQNLISSAGLNCKRSSMIFAGWHSLESPLNPMLLDENLHMNDEEAKFRDRRSNKRLLFDSINAALLNISQKATLSSYPWSRACARNKDDSLGGPLAEEVWGTIRSCLSCHESVTGESNYSSNAVDWLVKKEVMGRQWVESMWYEMYEFSKEVGGILLEELVEEALSELQCK